MVKILVVLSWNCTFILCIPLSFWRRKIYSHIRTKHNTDNHGLMPSRDIKTQDSLHFQHIKVHIKDKYVYLLKAYSYEIFSQVPTMYPILAFTPSKLAKFLYLWSYFCFNFKVYFFKFPHWHKVIVINFIRLEDK